LEAETRTIAVFADTRGRASCRGCHRPITWATVVKSGKKMPFTGDPVALHTETIDGRRVEYLDFAANHWGTCPKAPAFKRRPA